MTRLILKKTSRLYYIKICIEKEIKLLIQMNKKIIKN